MSSKPPSDTIGKPTPNVYAGAHVDRAAQIRKDAVSLQAAVNDDRAGFVAVWRERNLFTWVDQRPTARLLPREEWDPAIIVLVTDGDAALLGRSRAWAPGRYSAIAGFVEPGESLEDAVAREVSEETGIEVTDVRYRSSQPWPFPSSLMVGFAARATSTTIDCRDAELEDARWFTRTDIASGKLILSPPQSIAFRLIEDWYDEAARRPLRSEPCARIARVRG